MPGIFFALGWTEEHDLRARLRAKHSSFKREILFGARCLPVPPAAFVVGFFGEASVRREVEIKTRHAIESNYLVEFATDIRKNVIGKLLALGGARQTVYRHDFRAYVCKGITLP
jgi:hypothetical protein